MNPVTLKEIRNKIQSYLAATNSNTWSLARETGISRPTIESLLRGDSIICTYRMARNILQVVAPSDVHSFLQIYYPHLYHQKDPDPLGNQEKIDQAIQLALKSRVSYQIHSLASTSHGTSREMIGKVFGPDGINVLDFLLDQEVLCEKEDGTIFDPLLDTLQSDEYQLAQMVRYNLDIFEPTDEYSGITNRIQGYSKQGVQKFVDIFKESLTKIVELSENPENLGNECLFYTSIIGRISPANKGETQSSSYLRKQRYHLDSETSELLASLAHDMRGPFKLVMEFVQAHLDEHADSLEGMRARAAGRRLNSMIDALRHLESEEIVIRQMGYVNLDSVLCYAQSLADGSNRNFKFHGLKEFHGYLDIDKVERLIQNLLTNAFEAAHSEVAVECLQDKNALKLIVIDDGSGVPAELVPQLFGRGFSHGKKDGTGLGLSNVRRIAEGHDGQAMYERLDGKSRFVVVLEHVFVDAAIESDNGFLDMGNNRSANSCEHPVLFLKFSNEKVYEQVVRAVSEKLPEFEILSHPSSINFALLSCTDDISVASMANERSTGRVWLIDPSLVENSEFVPALVNLARLELKNFGASYNA